MVEIFDRYLSGWGDNEIVNHLNRPGGPPQHVDSKRNTARKWSKTTIRSLLENPVYTGRLYWNRLDFRQVKQGDGPLICRDPQEWIEVHERREALIPDDWFERAQAEMRKRSTGQASPKRRTPKRFYLLSGMVHCATGHNPLRMQGKTRKENTYYACGYPISYESRQRARPRQVAVHPGGPPHRTRRPVLRHPHLRPQPPRALQSQHAALARELDDTNTSQRQRLTAGLADLDQRIQRQIAAIEAGVDPGLVAQRIQALKDEKRETEIALATLTGDEHDRDGIDLNDACAILDALPDLSAALAAADPQLRRRVYQAFRLAIELDRNQGLISYD